MRAQAGIDSSLVTAQEGRVRSTFQRQLSEPGPTLDAVMDEYGAWEEDKEALGKMSGPCITAKKAYADREGFEAGVRQATAENVVSCWVDYGMFEQGKGAMKRALCVMERGCLMCCLSPQYWQAYVTCMVASGGDASTVYSRAVRNCPESSPRESPLSKPRAENPEDFGMASGGVWLCFITPCLPRLFLTSKHCLCVLFFHFLRSRGVSLSDPRCFLQSGAATCWT